MKKILTFGIIILFIGMTISSSTGINLEKQSTVPTLGGNTLYVGGDGHGNYTRIQDAIDNASDGDTVFVYDDSSPYYENVVVDKSITLMGEDKNTTIIDGNKVGDVIQIIADRINLSEFTIRGSGSLPAEIDDAGLHIYSDYNYIYDNNFTENGCNGIYLEGSSNNNITRNKIIYNEYGIRLASSNKNSIYLNSIDKNFFGFYIYFSNDNEITCNNIRNWPKLKLLFGINAWFIEAKNMTWDKNFWVGLRDFLFGTLGASFFDLFLPRLIFGKILSGGIAMLPSVQFDWHPAQEPYDIPIGV